MKCFTQAIGLVRWWQWRDLLWVGLQGADYFAGASAETDNVFGVLLAFYSGEMHPKTEDRPGSRTSANRRK